MLSSFLPAVRSVAQQSTLAAARPCLLHAQPAARSIRQHFTSAAARPLLRHAQPTAHSVPRHFTSAAARPLLHAQLDNKDHLVPVPDPSLSVPVNKAIDLGAAALEVASGIPSTEPYVRRADLTTDAPTSLQYPALTDQPPAGETATLIFEPSSAFSTEAALRDMAQYMLDEGLPVLCACLIARALRGGREWTLHCAPDGMTSLAQVAKSGGPQLQRLEQFKEKVGLAQQPLQDFIHYSDGHYNLRCVVTHKDDDATLVRKARLFLKLSKRYSIPLDGEVMCLLRAVDSDIKNLFT